MICALLTDSANGFTYNSGSKSFFSSVKLQRPDAFFRSKSVSLSESTNGKEESATKPFFVSEVDKPAMDLEEARRIVPPELLMSEEERWQEQLNSKEIQEVREELVLKYTSLGSSRHFRYRNPKRTGNTTKSQKIM